MLYLALQRLDPLTIIDELGRDKLLILPEGGAPRRSSNPRMRDFLFSSTCRSGMRRSP